MNDNKKDAFDLWWEWAEKPLDSMLTIDAEIHDAVMALPPDERRDRAKVNEAVRRERDRMTDQDRPRVGTPGWTEADDQRLRSLAMSGMTCREIAGEIGRSISAVQYRAKKLGLSLKQVKVRRRL
jgi:hypothetical protein